LHDCPPWAPLSGYYGTTGRDDPRWFCCLRTTAAATKGCPTGTPMRCSLRLGWYNHWGQVNFLYAMKGNNSTVFARYSPSGDTWEYLAPLPEGVPHGGSVC